MNKRPALLAAVLLVGAAGVGAQQIATYSAAQVPATQGTVAQYSLTPRGDIDGLILQDGTQVHLPPHLGAQLAAAVKPGAAVTVRGLKASGVPVIQALSIKNEATGAEVTDSGLPQPPPAPPGTQAMTVQGKVKEALYGPRGDVNGALLDDGTQIHLPPAEATRLNQDLQPGQTVVAEGFGIVSPYGRVMEARRIGPSATQLADIAPGRPPHGPPPGGPGAPPPPPPPQ